MFRTDEALRRRIEAHAAASGQDEGTLRVDGRDIRYFRGEDGSARAIRALHGLARQDRTVVPPFEAAPGIWCLIL